MRAYVQASHAHEDFEILFFFTLLHLILSIYYRFASEGPLKGILGYTDEDVVSNDFVCDSR